MGKVELPKRLNAADVFVDLGGVLNTSLPELVTATRLPVCIGGVSSVFGCDAITKAGAEPLGQDIDHGLQRLKEILGN